MLKLFERPLFLLALILVAVLPVMALMPFSDTTEPRYAEIARLMLERNDWITPWFDPQTPFWGKPPLSFWLQALSMKFFGVSEFAARLPSYLSLCA
ncbi:ArnT family glycosyltransferase, partial [Oligella urethralis]